MRFKAREKWKKNLGVLRLLCMVCIQCRKSVEKLVPKDSWQRLMSVRTYLIKNLVFYTYFIENSEKIKTHGIF